MGFIRITSGKLKGRKIRTPGGDETRPLLTRLRKSLADILRPRLAGRRVLDLFGGSGAIAFELISNGAARAAIVELNAKTAGLIDQNAKDLGVRDAITSLRGDGIAAVGGLAAQGAQFDIIIVAPPYGRGLQQKALEALRGAALLAPDGVIVVQREEREPSDEKSGRLRRISTRSYGRTVFDFYEETTTEEMPGQ